MEKMGFKIVFGISILMLVSMCVVYVLGTEEAKLYIVIWEVVILLLWILNRIKK